MINIINKLNRYWVIILVYTWVLLPGCDSSHEKGAPISGITIGSYKGDVSALIYMAKDSGLFKKNGLNVTIKDFEAGKLAVDALLANQVDIATAGEFVFITNLPDHPDLRIFATISDFRIDSLIARKDKGISHPRDLRGKKIGVLRQATSEFFLGRFLVMNGITLDDVTIVDLAPSKIANALLNGEIDAGQTWEPHVYRIKKELGNKAIVWSGEHISLPSTETFLLITREKWLRDHGEEGLRLILSILQSQTAFKANPDSAKRFIADKFDLKKDYVNYVYPKIDFKVELAQSLLLIMEDEARWAIDSKLIPNSIPNYLPFIHTDILDKVKPEVVSIIH